MDAHRPSDLAHNLLHNCSKKKQKKKAALFAKNPQHSLELHSKPSPTFPVSPDQLCFLRIGILPEGEGGSLGTWLVINSLNV